MTAEQGKPLAEAEGEIAYAASFIEWFCRTRETRQRRNNPLPGADKRLMVIRRGVGGLRGDHPVELPGGDDHP